METFINVFSNIEDFENIQTNKKETIDYRNISKIQSTYINLCRTLEQITNNINPENINKILSNNPANIMTDIANIDKSGNTSITSGMSGILYGIYIAINNINNTLNTMPLYILFNTLITNITKSINSIFIVNYPNNDINLINNIIGTNSINFYSNIFSINHDDFQKITTQQQLMIVSPCAGFINYKMTINNITEVMINTLIAGIDIGELVTSDPSITFNININNSIAYTPISFNSNPDVSNIQISQIYRTFTFNILKICALLPIINVLNITYLDNITNGATINITTPILIIGNTGTTQQINIILNITKPCYILTLNSNVKLTTIIATRQIASNYTPFYIGIGVLVIIIIGLIYKISQNKN